MKELKPCPFCGESEDVVDMLSRGIYQVLQDNGERLFDLKEGKKK